MKALLKTGEWVEIDTKYLFNDQYNTIDGRRIFDRDIESISDDVRDGKGKCRYCGAIVNKGEELKHFEAMEARTCSGCFWYRNTTTDRKVERKTEEGKNERGETVRITTVVETSHEVPKCTYHDGKTVCTNKECRAYGIEWFTPQNTFFLKYPGGVKSIPVVDKLSIRGFHISDSTNAPYFQKIGSYSLQAQLTNDRKGIESFYIYNCRKRYSFQYKDGEFILILGGYGMGPVIVKHLPDIPSRVESAIISICKF